MDPEEIARRVNSLKISPSNSEEPFILPADLASFGQQRLESCLVGKVLSSKAVNRETFRVQMPRILQAKKPVKIEVIGENTFLLDFTSNIDQRHTLMDGPWSFFKDLVVFKAPVGFQKPEDMVLDEIPMWVQFHNVPIAFMHENILRSIGSRIGRVIEVDAGDDGSCKGRFARIRVSLNITKPLRQGIWVKPENSQEELCIILLYERLPNFCFKCGRLGHVQRDCEVQEETGSETKFGHWLRASSVSGDPRSFNSKNNSPNSNTPSSGPYQEKEGLKDSMALATSPTNHPETASSREKSATEDNTMLATDYQEQSTSIPAQEPTTLGKDQSTEEGIILDPESRNTNHPIKKKWKRLARGNSMTSVEKTEISPTKNRDKHHLIEHEAHNDNAERTRLQGCGMSRLCGRTYYHMKPREFLIFH